MWPINVSPFSKDVVIVVKTHANEVQRPACCQPQVILSKWMKATEEDIIRRSALSFNWINNTPQLLHQQMTISVHPDYLKPMHSVCQVT